MTAPEIVGIAVSLAMDAFAVALAAGTSEQTRGVRPAFRLSFHFGLFQFGMPVLGWLAGTSLAGAVAGLDHWVAFGLLAVVGGHMVRSGLGPDARPGRSDPSRGWSLVGLSLATSLDALAVGFSLAMLGVDIVGPAAVIGVVTAALSLLGLRVGRRLGDAFGHRMELIGGIVLLVIGLRMLLSHLA